MGHKSREMENLVNRRFLLEKFSNKNVFVTGHTGFKGSWLLCILKQLGAKVKGYALAPETDENLYCIVNDEGTLCESILRDIRDGEGLKEEILSFQPDFIFHLAAQPLVRYSFKEPLETFEVNTMGTANLLDALRSLQKKCSVVVVTTDKVYLNIESHMAYTESDRLGGFDPYSTSKAMAELVTSSYRDSFFNIKGVDEHQKSICTARAGNVIGGGDWSKDRIIPDIVAALAAGNAVQVRNPDAIRPWQHVLEPLFGYLLLVAHLSDSPKEFSGAWNFGPMPGDQLTVAELVNKAIFAWGSGEMTIIKDLTAVHEAGLLKLDIGKAIKCLSWKPLLDADTAVQWTIDWYKQDEKGRKEFTYQQIDQYMRL